MKNTIALWNRRFSFSVCILFALNTACSRQTTQFLDFTGLNGSIKKGAGDIAVSTLKEDERRGREEEQSQLFQLVPNCSEALEFLKASYSQQWEQEKKRKLITKQMPDYAYTAPMAKNEVTVEASQAPVATPNGPNSHTGTNNQVNGMDEGDIFKTNGKNIFIIDGDKLRILKSWPAAELAQISELKVEGYAKDLVLGENKTLAIISVVQVYNSLPHAEGVAYKQIAAQQAQTKVTLVDVSDISKPSVSSEYFFDGQSIAVRKIDNALRLVLRSQLAVSPFDLVYNANNDDGIFYASLASALNIDIFPKTRIKSGDTETSRSSCLHVFKGGRSIQGLTRIIGIDLEKKTMGESVLLDSPSQILVTEKSLYLTGYVNLAEGIGYRPATRIHKFDISDHVKAAYVASGEVEGSLLNSFAMDEFEGHLRVATTLQDSRGLSKNRVSVLAPNGKMLQIIGSTPDLAAGERIYSVRFDGKKAYVVTFRQIDPLFTLDLSTPTAPKVVGELKVPGFSTYIHLIGDTHLLTMGDDGRGRMKLSLFDVSDFAQPREVDSLVISRNAHSDARWEHKAFTYDPKTKMLAIPVNETVFLDNCPQPQPEIVMALSMAPSVEPSRSTVTKPSCVSSYRYTSGTLLFEVDTSAGLKELDFLESSKAEDASSRYQTVHRNIFMDNFIFAVGTSGLRAWDLNSREVPLASLNFVQEDEPVPVLYGE